MAQRQMIIEPSSLHGKCIQLHVEDRTPIGPWTQTLAARCGCPLVDSFGTPIAYRLRCGNRVLPMTGRFADVRFPSGSHFVLEAAMQTTVPLQENLLGGSSPLPALPLSRRALMGGGLLSVFSLLGFGSGMGTAVAQHLLRRQSTPIPRTHLTHRLFTLTLRTLFPQHQQPVRAISWAPDEHALVSGGDDNRALIWKMDGTVLSELVFNAPVRALAWSPDGMQLAAGSATTVSFFNVQTESLLDENAVQHTAPVTSLAWIEGSASLPLALSAGRDTRAIVWNGQTHQPQVVFRQHTTAIEALAVLAQTVATASHGGVVRVWNALSGQEIHGYYADSLQPLRAIAFSSAGSLALGGDAGIVSLWNDGRTCTLQRQDTFGMRCIDPPAHLPRQNRPVRAIAFSPDGTLLATGGDDNNLIMWSVQTMTPLFQQLQHDAIVALSWSASGQFLAGAVGSRVAVWHVHR
jgi:WD40 repeat protein